MEESYEFRVEVTRADRSIEEIMYSLPLDDNEVKKLRQVAKEVEEVVADFPRGELIFPNNLCEFSSLYDIYRRIYVQWLNNEGVEEIDDITQEDIDKLKKRGYSLKIEFPPEVLYPYIWKQNKCFIMRDCFSFPKTLIEKTYDDCHTITNILKFVFPRRNNDNNVIDTNDLDGIFDRFDSPLLYRLSVSHNDQKKTNIPLMGGEVCDYLYRCKLPSSCFGITYYDNPKKDKEEIDDGPKKDKKEIDGDLKKDKKEIKKNLPGMDYPQFGEKARQALLYKFFVQKRENTPPNTLKYQLNPKFVEITKDGDELKIDNYKESFSEIDGWYYEMCTGLTLSLAISAQLYEFSKAKSDNPSLWANYRLPVLLKILGIYYPLIVSCPAVYWRISMLQKVIQRVDEEMQKPGRIVSPNTYNIYGPPPVRNELEWFQDAHSSFCLMLERELFHRLMPVGYQGALKQFSQILIVQAYLQHNNLKGQDRQSGKMFKYNPLVYCLSNDNYTSKVRNTVRKLQNKLKGKPNGETSSRIRNDAGGEYGKIFEKVRNALYPGGFIDFQA